MIRSGMQRKSRKCKICKNTFMPRSITHKVCGAECSNIFVQQEKLKAEKQKEEAAKEAARAATKF